MELQAFLSFLGEEFDFNTQGITEETTFKEINFDEFDMIELVMSIEDKYRIEIDDDLLYSISTIGDMLRIFDRLL